MDRFLRTIVPEVQYLVDNKRISEAIFALEDTIAWSLTHLGLTWAKDFLDLKKAEKYLKIVAHTFPGNWIFHINLAHVLNLSNKWEEAKIEAMKAVEFAEGKHYEPYYNLGVILANLGDHPGAVDCYHKAMAINAEPNLASYNICSSLFLLEQWEEAWKTYENRLVVFEKTRKIRERFGALYKAGDPSSGKIIYVFSEQGVGDLLQFARYLPKFQELTGSKIIVEVQEAVLDLMKNNFEFEMVPRKDGIWPEVPKVDYAISICSLPGLFKAGIKPIPNSPYIKAPQKDLPCYLKTEKIKVGVCWAGNADHVNDWKRSAYLFDFLPLGEIKNVQLFSLQKDCTDRKWFGKHVNLMHNVGQTDIIDLSSLLNDYNDTAYYISQMDFIVTIDTSVAHLAGAMGKIVWLLIDAHNDWRWGLKNTKTDWYPSMRIFRQEKLGDWASVMSQVVTELNLLVNGMVTSPDSSQIQQQGQS